MLVNTKWLEGGILEGLNNGSVKGRERVERDKEGGGGLREGRKVLLLSTLHCARYIYKPLWLIINQCHGERGREVQVKYLSVRITILTEGKKGEGVG